MRAAETKTAKPCVVVFFEHAGSAMMSYSTGRWSSHLNDFNIDEEVFLLIVARCRLQSVGVDREMKLTLISISPARRSMEWLEFPCRSP